MYFRIKYLLNAYYHDLFAVRSSLNEKGNNSTSHTNRCHAHVPCIWQSVSSTTTLHGVSNTNITLYLHLHSTPLL